MSMYYMRTHMDVLCTRGLVVKLKYFIKVPRRHAPCHVIQRGKGIKNKELGERKISHSGKNTYLYYFVKVFISEYAFMYLCYPLFFFIAKGCIFLLLFRQINKNS